MSNWLSLSLINPQQHPTIHVDNATVLAYGQTGSGKTYSILGPGGGVGAGVGRNTDAPTAASVAGRDDETNSAGVIPRAVRELFQMLEHRKLNAKNAHGAGTKTTFR